MIQIIVRNLFLCAHVQNPFHLAYSREGGQTTWFLCCSTSSSNFEGHVCWHVHWQLPMFCFYCGNHKDKFYSTLCPGLGLTSVLPVSLGREVLAGGGLCSSFGSGDPARVHARPNRWNPFFHPQETKRYHYTKKGSHCRSFTETSM